MLDAFTEVVGARVGIGREDAVWDGPQPSEALVFGEKLHKDALAHLNTHSRYHQREMDWQQAWGTMD